MKQKLCGDPFYIFVLALVLECHRNRKLLRWEVTSRGLLVQSLALSRDDCLVDNIDRCECSEEAASFFLV